MGKYCKRFIQCLAAFIILSMCMTLFLFRTNVEASIFGTKNYYLALEKDNLKKFIKKSKVEYLAKNLTEASYACKVNAELSGDLMGSDQEMKSIADYLSKLELFINYNANSKDLNNLYYTSLISAKYDGTKLADIDIKSADNKTIIALPELTDKTLGIEGSKTALKFTQAFLDDDKAFKEIFGLTRADYNSLVKKYIKDIIINEIPEENVVFDSKSSFQNIECNSITFNFDQKILSKIYKAVAKELAKDKEFKILLSSVANTFYEIANEQQKSLSDENLIEKPTEEEIDEQIKEMVDELDMSAEDMEEVQFSYIAYFENDGDILSRQVKDKLNDAGAKLSTYKDISGVNIFNFNIQEGEDTTFELTNKSKLLSGSTYEGIFNVDITGKSLIETKYKYDKDAKAGGLNAFVGEVEGKINMEQLDESSLTNYTDSDLNNIYFSFVNKKTDTDTLMGRAKITSKVDGKRMGVTIATEVKQSNVANITKPEVSIAESVEMSDYSALSEMGDEISENFMSKFSELFPQADFGEDYTFEGYEGDF